MQKQVKVQAIFLYQVAGEIRCNHAWRRNNAGIPEALDKSMSDDEIDILQYDGLSRWIADLYHYAQSTEQQLFADSYAYTIYQN